MSKIVLISGASSGIGLATAKFLKEKGYKVIGLSRRLPQTEVDFDYIECDITNQEKINNLVDKLNTSVEKVDVLINCAGIGVSGAVEYSSLEEVKRIFDVNVFGQFLLTKAIIPFLRNSNNPRIINIGSVAGELTIPFQTFYSMTKAAISSFSEGLRLELAPFNIQVTTVLPGDIKTDFTKNRSLPNIPSENKYGSRIENSISRMAKDEENGMNPISVSKVIYKLINKRRLPVAKTVGFKYKLFVLLSRILPKRLVSYVIKKMYG